MVLKSVILEGQKIEPSELKGDPHHLAPFLRDLIKYTKPERILDPTAGSGVTAMIGEETLIPVSASDLNDPTDGTDLFSIEDENTYDLVVYHPDVWMARPDAAHPHDLGGTMTWDAYVDLNADAIEHLATLVRPGGHLVAVCPISRRRGSIGDLHRDLVCLLGAPNQPTIVHPHPSCRSRGTLYGRKYMPIAHDNILVWTKEELVGGPVADDETADTDAE